jgi:uncharacterized protein (DUF305 family)
VAVTTACTADDEGPVTVQPGAPGESGRVLTDEELARQDHPHTAADVAFLHAMIAHHTQAIRMTDLVAERTGREDIPLLAQRIEISQADEIAVMEDWLGARGEPITGHDHDTGGLMPGMLTEAQFADLEAATGAEFDQLFLEMMIYHHEGAVHMVENLVAAGGGQQPELFQIVSHIDSDQRIEIGRMRRLLLDLTG